MATGLTVIFTNSVSNMRKLQIVDLDDTLLDIMKAFVDLVEYRFNMQILQALSEKLHTGKENKKQLLNRRSHLKG